MLFPSRGPRARSRRFLILVTLTVLVATVFTSTASAASVRRTWKTQLGASGPNGTATLTAYWAGTGALGLKLVGLQPSTTYPVIAYRGSCVTSLDGVFGIGQEQLWIQTSEGPRGTAGKLIVVAKRIGYAASIYEAAHPVARPVVCR